MNSQHENQLDAEKLDPEKLDAEDLISEELILEETNPEGLLSEEVISEELDPEGFILEEIILEDSNPEGLISAVTLEESNPEESNQEESNQEESNLEESNLEESNLEESNLEESNPEESNPEESNPEESDLEEEDSDGNEIRSDGDIRTRISSTLEQIKTPNAFAYSATDPFLPNPVLYLPPHGTLGLPLSADDAQKIISQASQSPFGKGEETLIDTTFRKSWELNPNQFVLRNPAWNKGVQKILDTVSKELGLEEGTGNVSAELYKLLLYEPGAFFKPHKDSEKAPGMFATLVVCLPSPHEGGKLVLTHDNEKYEFETASSSSFDCSYAAWYSDITHEVQPVVSGYRLMLTYNLIRKTGIEIPSYNLVCGSVKQLLTLLEEYKLQLEKKDGMLPPILLHRLEHKYTQASLKLNLLKPPDLAQVQVLAQLSTRLGFDIYLATLVLEVKKDDDYDEFEEKSQSLEKIVELDGTLVEESLGYPAGSLINPMPRDEDEDADEEEHEGYTGNEGSPATYWYRDTVVVLVPPSKRLDFVFKFTSNRSFIIEPLFFKLMQEFSEDPAKKPKLELLCELALNVDPWEYYHYHPQPSESIPPFFRLAAATALDLGRIDLFDKACKTTKDKIILDNARELGRWVANNGVATNTVRLMKGLLIGSSVGKKVDFLKAVAEGFETAVPEPTPAERVILKQWSDEAIFTAAARLIGLTIDDAMCMAQLCKHMDWCHFESKAKLIILRRVTMTKIAFVKELMSTLQQELNKEQRSFIEMIIYSIWNNFGFDAKCHKVVPQTSWLQRQSYPDHLNINDVLYIVENTITILSSNCVETTIIPAMLAAIPGAPKVCAAKLFILLVQMILKNELPGFILNNHADPPHSHKRLVQSLLTKFLLDNVCFEPQAPTNWSLPTCSCKCSDCSVVNRFLQDPIKQSFDFPCAQKRRSHLNSSFYDRSSYDITTISGCSPNIWRITKHRRGYQSDKSQWMKTIEYVLQTLSSLKKVELVEGRLETYLQPYYSVIMNAKFKELPDLKALVTMTQLSETNENTAPTHNQLTNQTGHKREASTVLFLEDGIVKRVSK